MSECDGPGATHYLDGCECQLRRHDWLEKVETRARQLVSAMRKAHSPKTTAEITALDELEGVLVGDE